MRYLFKFEAQTTSVLFPLLGLCTSSPVWVLAGFLSAEIKPFVWNQVCCTLSCQGYLDTSSGSSGLEGRIILIQKAYFKDKEGRTEGAASV